MTDFIYDECKTGDLLCLTTMNKADGAFCKFEKGKKLFARIINHSYYSMVIIDKRGNEHVFLKDFFKDTKDEFHGEASLYNPDGVIVKLQKITKKELPLWLKIRTYLGTF